MSRRSAHALFFVALASSLTMIACGDDVPVCVAYSGTSGGASGTGGTGGAGGMAIGGRGDGGSGGHAGGVAGSIGGGPAGTGGGGIGGGAAGTGGNAGTGGGAAGVGGGRGGTTGGGAGGKGGGGGTGDAPVPPTPGYSGCSRSGGVDRITLTKLQSSSGLCYDFNLWLTQHTPDPALTLPSGWMLMGAVARPCAAGSAAIATATATGSVTWPPQIGFLLPSSANIDVTLTFGASGSDAGVPASEKLTAQNVDLHPTCP